MYSYFCQLNKSNQIGSIKDYFQKFRDLSLMVENILEENLKELLLGGLK